MAASLPFHIVKLNQNDVPGAKFVYDSIEKHSNTQLMRWLECRGQIKSGNRSTLLKRVHDCVSAGTDQIIDVGVDNGKWYELKKENRLNTGAPCSVPLLPYAGWKPFPSSKEVIPKHFNKGHIHHHVVESVQFLNNSDNDSDDSDCDIEDLHTAKPLRKGLKFFESGHVQKLQDCSKSGHYFMKAKVMASMKSDVFYDVTVTISQMSGFVKDASCTCIASAMGRCSHVTGLLYALVDCIEKMSNDPTFDLSCTSQPCSWNKGRQKGKKPKRVQELSYSTKKRKIQEVINFDPRGPSTVVGNDSEVKQALLWSLSTHKLQKSMWSTIIVQTYSDYPIDEDHISTLKEWRNCFLDNLKSPQNSTFPILLVSDQKSDKWYVERRVRLTASTCHKVVNLKSDSAIASFLNKQLWNSDIVKCATLSYGIENEKNARQSYQMLKNIDRLKVIETGLWASNVHPELACSPDGLVLDLDENSLYGILEIKCPKILENKKISDFDTVLNAKQLKKFCLEKIDDEIIVKKNHSYYYQMQMQMGVTGLQFCDFVVWSAKETFIKRIRFDELFWKELKDNLIRFHHNYLVPELYEMKLPRDLSLVKLEA